MSPTGQRLLEGPPDQSQRPSCLGKESAHLWGASPWEENIVGLAALEDYEED
jgi:hypothetical protein